MSDIKTVPLALESLERVRKRMEGMKKVLISTDLEMEFSKSVSLVITNMVKDHVFASNGKWTFKGVDISESVKECADTTIILLANSLKNLDPEKGRQVIPFDKNRKEPNDSNS